MEPDPRDELFDILEASGEPAGYALPRAVVHREGHWHRSFHCWVALRGMDGRASVVFQRRGPDKDTAPCLLDVSIGGHYRAGETIRQVIREAEEELGLALRLEDLIPAGTRRAQQITPDYTDREIQDVFVYVLGQDLTTLRPQPSEISALCVVAVDDVITLFGGESATATAVQLAIDHDRSLGPPEPVALGLADFVPVTDNYWARGASLARRALDGEREFDLGLW